MTLNINNIILFGYIIPAATYFIYHLIMLIFSIKDNDKTNFEYAFNHLFMSFLPIVNFVYVAGCIILVLIELISIPYVKIRKFFIKLAIKDKH